MNGVMTPIELERIYNSEWSYLCDLTGVFAPLKNNKVESFLQKVNCSKSEMLQR